MKETQGHDLLEHLLITLDTEKGSYMLSDLRDPQKRTPQLYNAVEKYLERHNFAISKLIPDTALLGNLAVSLDEVRLLSDDELYGSLQ